jgi:hypothetical protein
VDFDFQPQKQEGDFNLNTSRAFVEKFKTKGISGFQEIPPFHLVFTPK